jgi:hypothetical protein
MTFYQSPKVDNKSKTSEESVLAVKNIFLKKNGFICRDEIPDYGVDLEVELIFDSEKVTGNKFSIQIKSTENIKIISKNDLNYVSLEFETSRLGYLCKKPPTYGLIAIYDDKSKIIYYDFVVDIVNRITVQRENEEWKNQNYININIPISKILNEQEANNIHTRFSNIFNNHYKLLKEHGSKYGIPVFAFNQISNEEKYNFENIDDTIKFLNKFGIYLINNQYFAYLYQFLSKLSFNEINKSPKLILIAVLTYNEIGMYVEADYYLKKSYAFLNNYSKDEQDIIRILESKLKFIFGIFDYGEYLKNLEKLEKSIDNKINRLFISVFILYIKILTKLKKRESIKDLLSDINQLISKTEKIEIDKTRKHLIIILLADYVYEIGINLFIKYARLIKIRENLNIQSELNKRVNWFNEINELTSKSYKYVYDSYKYSITEKNEFIKAYSLFKMSGFFFRLNFMSIQVNDNYHYSEEDKNQFIEKIRDCNDAYNIFIKMSLFYEAYHSLTLLKEISKLYSEIFSSDINIFKKDNLELLINNLEKKIGIKEYESIVTQFISNNPKSMGIPESFKNLSENDIEFFAKTMIEALDIPNDRLNNLILDLKNLKFFYSNRFCKNLLIYQDLWHTRSKRTMYTGIIKYKIVCPLCGLESDDHENIESLFNSLNQERCISK